MKHLKIAFVIGLFGFFSVQGLTLNEAVAFPTVPDLSTMDPELQRLKTLFNEMSKVGAVFNTAEAERAIETLSQFGAQTQNPLDERSEAYCIRGGYEGKLAEKLGVRGGIGYIKRSMKSFKASLELNPDNADAAYDYAAVIDGMGKKSGFVRKFLELTLGLSLYDECKKSLKLLDHTETLGAEFVELITDLNQFCN